MEILIRSAAAARMLDIREDTLRKWRAKGKGPPWVRMGGAVRYQAEDVKAWVESQKQKEGK